MSAVQRRGVGKSLLRDGVPDLGLGRDSDSDDDHEQREKLKPPLDAGGVESSLARLRAERRKEKESWWLLAAGVAWLATLLLAALLLIKGGSRGQAPSTGAARQRTGGR